MTAILALPEIAAPIDIETGEDWLDALAFVDASGTPIALDGIRFHLQVRQHGAAGTLIDLVTASYFAKRGLENVARIWKR